MCINVMEIYLKKIKNVKEMSYSSLAYINISDKKNIALEKTYYRTKSSLWFTVNTAVVDLDLGPSFTTIYPTLTW